MRIAVGLLAFLGASALTSALADPQTEAQSAPAQSSAPPASAPATPAPKATASAPAAAAATPPAATKPAAPEIDPREKYFISKGYRPAMRNGVKVFCRRQEVLGSRLGGGYNCSTVEQLEAIEAQARQSVERMQQNTGTPSGH